jgi:integrase
MGYSPALRVRTVAQSVAVCFLTALRTGMRAGELTGLNWDRVEVDHVILPITKTKPRKVPLSDKALRLIDKMKGYDPQLVFGTNSRSLDANFRKYRDRAGLEGFTFHDSRHTAATMLSRMLDVMDLCRMFGWTDTRMALRYYNPSASSISQILNKRKKV